MGANHGHFVGNVSAIWLDGWGNDREMILTADFGYIDPDKREWWAPAGSVINGANIPRLLWRAIGPPFVGIERRQRAQAL